MKAFGPDTLIAGKYRLVELLGEGGMGAVWIAENVVLHKHVALKVMGAAVAGSADHASRFLREAVAASRVRHPAIVEIHDAGSDDGVPWIAMELLDGESLARRLSRGGLSTAEVARYLLPVIDALGALHAVGIVHRDLKPDNIFLEACADGTVRPKLLDFGIAKQLEATKLTRTGAILGTAFYLSPEQAQAAPNLDGRSDIYAMGVVLFESLSGAMPYEARSLTELIAKLFTELPRDLRSIAPSVSAPLAELVHRCLERHPADRPQSAQDLHSALARVLDASPRPTINEPLATARTAEAPRRPRDVAVATPQGDRGIRSLTDVTRYVRGRPWLLLLPLLPCCCWSALITRSCASMAGGVGGGLSDPIGWADQDIVILDADGHAPLDVAGFITRVRGSHVEIRVAAFDGANGDLIWQTQELGEGGIARLGLSEDGSVVALVGSSHAWDARTGAPLRTGSLPPISAGTSATATLGRTSRDSGAFQSLPVDALRIPGMHVATLLQDGASLARVALGWRDEGTDVPMVALLDGDRVVMAVDAPSRDPFLANTGAPGPIIVAHGRLLVFYGTSRARAMTAFDLSNGARLFDVDLEAVRIDRGSVVLGPDRIWIARGPVLDGYDSTTGEYAVRIGTDYSH